jgi:CheY-like chemotaxis protein
MDGYEATCQIWKWEVQKCDKCGKVEFQSSHVLAETNIECKHNRLPIVAVTADVMKETHNCATLQAWMITLPRYLINLSMLQITIVFS